MKSLKTMLALVVILLAAVASGSAWAYGGRHGGHHGGHVRFGVFVGAPAFWYYPSPYYYAPPYYAPRYYYDPGVTEYIERGDAQAAPEQAQAPGYWYYCADAKAYYPYVKQCPGGWQRVAPQPAPGS